MPSILHAVLRAAKAARRLGGLPSQTTDGITTIAGARSRSPALRLGGCGARRIAQFGRHLHANRLTDDKTSLPTSHASLGGEPLYATASQTVDKIE